MATTKFIIRCDPNLPVHDIDHLYETLNSNGDAKIEVNQWPDVTFTSEKNYFKVERLLNKLTNEGNKPILSWNTIPPIKRRYRKTVASIKKRIQNIIKG